VVNVSIVWPVLGVLLVIVGLLVLLWWVTRHDDEEPPRPPPSTPTADGYIEALELDADE
jgi:hypothetical protein